MLLSYWIEWDGKTLFFFCGALFHFIIVPVLKKKKKKAFECLLFGSYRLMSVYQVRSHAGL